MEDDKKTTESTNMLDNKHFWAAFLNLARHNVYITVNHINKILEEGEINRDGYENTSHSWKLRHIDRTRPIPQNKKKRNKPKPNLLKIWKSLFLFLYINFET